MRAWERASLAVFALNVAYAVFTYRCYREARG